MNSYQKDLEEINHFLSEYQFTNSELVKELNALVQGADDVVLLLYSRRSLEVIITDMCEELLKRERGTEPLKGLIDRLFKEKFIPSYIHTSMSNLNSMSTYGAHPKEFNQRQVKTTIIELTTVLEWYINELKKLKKKSDEKTEAVKIESIPETKKEEIKTEEKPKEVEEEVKAAETKKEPKVKDTTKKKKPVLVFVVIALVVTTVGVYLAIFSKKDVKPENQNTEQTEISEEPETTTSEKETKPEEEATKEIKTETTKPSATESKPAEKPIELPDDLGEALNKISDTSLEKRKQAAEELLKRFSENAFFIISNEGVSASEYILGKLLLGYYHYEVKILEKENNLIKKVELKEIKK